MELISSWTLKLLLKNVGETFYWENDITTCGARYWQSLPLVSSFAPISWPNTGVSHPRAEVLPQFCGQRREGKRKNHVGNAFSQMREGPWDGRPNSGSFVLPEWLKLLRENLLSVWWESPWQKAVTCRGHITVSILYGAAAVLSLIRYKICTEEVIFNKKRKGKRWAKKRKNQGSKHKTCNEFPKSLTFP